MIPWWVRALGLADEVPAEATARLEWGSLPTATPGWGWSPWRWPRSR